MAIVGIGYAWKPSGAEDLRTQIYQPIYADICGVEESIQAVSREKVPTMQTLAALRRTGAVERIPSWIQNRLAKVSEEASRIHSAVIAVNEIVIREMSYRIMQARSEDTDQTWSNNAAATLRQMSSSGKGISDSVTLFDGVAHSGRSRTMDLRDPRKPVIGGPGGTTYVIGDWLEYPASISAIDQLWTDVDYLYFNDITDYWYYRLTREDLKRANTTLIEFLRPVYDILGQSADFQLLLNTRSAVLSEISDIKAILAERIRDPKHLGDLISR
jgi:hypothetical protein